MAIPAAILGGTFLATKSRSKSPSRSAILEAATEAVELSKQAEEEEDAAAQKAAAASSLESSSGFSGNSSNTAKSFLLGL